MFGPLSPYIRLKCRKDYKVMQKNEMVYGYKKLNGEWLVAKTSTDCYRNCFWVPEGYVKELDYIVDYVQSDTAIGKSDGCTALHAAAKLGNKQIVQELLENGWSPTKRNAAGMTPIDVALQSNFRTLAEILRIYADCNGLLYKSIANNNHIKHEWPVEKLGKMRFQYDFQSNDVTMTLDEHNRQANFGAWSNGIPTTMRCSEAHFATMADGAPRMLAKRGDILTAVQLMPDGNYSCRQSDSLELFKNSEKQRKRRGAKISFRLDGSCRKKDDLRKSGRC